ncbi:MAG: aldo/keto reductase, partial [Anaerolineales bacterium]|nr:aldo/keto reductase [Anaerolineales bacterium]
GHAVADDDGADWQVQTITNSIDRSLRRMKTDYLDLIQLHSCGVHVLERGDAIRALQDARQAGKVRFIGYSGDNAAARWAIDSGLFDTLQTSYNLVDQHARTRLFSHAVRQGMGIIAKRPVANAVWGASVSPRRYANAYLDRAQQMLAAGPIPEAPDNGVLLALGFVLAETAVDVAIVGTRTPEKMEMNIRWLHTALPISNAAVSALQARFTAVGPNWPQLL